MTDSSQPVNRPTDGNGEPEGMLAAIKRLADDAYCRYIDAGRKPLCLGQAIKLEKGQFTEENLAAHKAAERLLGRHQGLHDALRILKGEQL